MEPRVPRPGRASRRRSRAWLLAIVVLLAAGAIAARFTRHDPVRIVRGEVEDVNVDGAAMSLDGEGYLIGTGLTWQGLDGSWRQGGQPECMPPLSGGATVELGVMSVPSAADAPGMPNHVVWVKCLSEPTRLSDLSRD